MRIVRRNESGKESRKQIMISLVKQVKMFVVGKSRREGAIEALSVRAAGTPAMGQMDFRRQTEGKCEKSAENLRL